MTVVNMVGNPKYTNVDIFAVAADSAEVDAVGMLNIDAGNVKLTSVKIRAYLGTKSYGMKNIRTNPICNNVKASIKRFELPRSLA